MYNSRLDVQFWDFCTQGYEALSDKEMFIKGFNPSTIWLGSTEQEESFKFFKFLWIFNTKTCIN